MSFWPISLTAAAACIVVGFIVAESSAAEPADAAAKARQFIADYESAVRPLEIEVAHRWWTANVSGKDEDYKAKEEAEGRLELKLADPAAFARLAALKKSPPADPLLARQVALLHLQYLSRQVEPELLKAMIARANAIEKAFVNYRPTVGGKKLTDNQVREILRTSRDSDQRRAAWEASKAVAPLLRPDLMELVKLRNQTARKLGFADYHVMQLALAEQSQEQVLKLFDELDELTREPFRAAKRELDAALAAACGIKPEAIRPWHYHDPFFQESPAIFAGAPKEVYKQIDPVKFCEAFFGGIGLPVADVLRRSDLYEKPGKNPHAFCNDLDRQGDVRILCNIVPGEEWLSTTLHELGHAVYSSKNIPAEMPYVLRTDAHALCTEGIAMMFERFVGQAATLQALGVKVPEPDKFTAAAAKIRRNRLLIFSRWAQVMFRFEKELYANPEQDLNRRWWELVEKYQEVRRPEGRDQPDFAAKIHIVSAPAYYHNYLMGELFAAQVHRAICREALGGAAPRTANYAGQPAVGEFLRRRVFGPGRTLDWNALTRHATGAELNPKAFAAELEGK